MLTWRVGVAASPAAGRAMAEYLSADMLRAEEIGLARYYGAEGRERERAPGEREPSDAISGLDAALSLGELRPELSPAFAARLGIPDLREPLTLAGLAHLLNRFF